MATTSAGLLLYRRVNGGIEVLLGHPGGPWWRGKDAGAWTIPKGEIGPDEDALHAACREFTEETGAHIQGPFLELRPVRMRSGKVIRAWAAEGDLDAAAVRSNEFEMEWPPRSGVVRSFPELDRARWCGVEEAKRLMNPSQVALLDELLRALEDRAE